MEVSGENETQMQTKLPGEADQMLYAVLLFWEEKLHELYCTMFCSYHAMAKDLMDLTLKLD